jgi:hypothetical protein
MTPFREIHIENLADIQREVLMSIPKHLLLSTNLTYIENNKDVFLTLPSIKKVINDLKLPNYCVGQVAINVTMGYDNGNYHMDSGPYRYSLNIPISGCENTWINFYNTLANPHVVTVENKGKTHHFFRYYPDDCELIESHETSVPYLLSVKVPHRVENKSPNMRVMLLIRIFDLPVNF